MITWKHFIGEKKSLGHSYKLNEYTYQARYEDLEDSKGRTPGHIFTIYKIDNDTEWSARQHAQRAGIEFGAFQHGRQFEDLEEAKAHLEAQAAKAFVAVYKNKQFTKK